MGKNPPTDGGTKEGRQDDTYKAAFTSVWPVAGCLAASFELLMSKHLQSKHVLEKGHGFFQASDLEHLSSTAVEHK